MLRLTANSRKLSYLLWIRDSICYNIGIIGDYWYCYNYNGASRFKLRPGYENDTRFPGDRSTRERISTKYLLSLLSDDILDRHGN